MERAKADFIVIGAMKCATSTVRGYLANHPDVSIVHEPNFFSHDDNYSKGIGWYNALFRGNNSRQGEASNAYAELWRYPQTVERMQRYNPALNIIYMVRHPIDRMLSAWIQYRSNSADYVAPTPDQAVIEKPELFIGTSLYWQTISHYRDAFSDDQIFVGFVEDLERDSYGFFARLENFLGIYSDDDIAYERRANPSAGKKILTPFYSRLRQLPFAKTARKMLPQRTKDIMKYRLTKPVPDRLEFSPATRLDLTNSVRDDSKKFLSHYGKSSDFWKLD